MIVAFEMISKILCSSDWIKFPCVESLKSDIRGMMRSLVMNTDLSQPLNLHLSSSDLQAGAMNPTFKFFFQCNLYLMTHNPEHPLDL